MKKPLTKSYKIVVFHIILYHVLLMTFPFICGYCVINSCMIPPIGKWPVVLLILVLTYYAAWLTEAVEILKNKIIKTIIRIVAFVVISVAWCVFTIALFGSLVFGFEKFWKINSEFPGENYYISEIPLRSGSHRYLLYKESGYIFVQWIATGEGYDARSNETISFFRRSDSESDHEPIFIYSGKDKILKSYNNEKKD